MIGLALGPGGSIVNWPLRRELLSRGGNLYTRHLLGFPVRDATAGYRLFRRTTLERIELETSQSSGYVFQADLACAPSRPACGSWRCRSSSSSASAASPR